MATTEGHNGRVRFLEQWIDGTAVESSLSEQQGYDVAASGFTWNLYENCLKLLKEIIQVSERIKQPELLPVSELKSRSTNFEVTSLKECLSRLFLWGEGFSGGQLDKIIQRSDALKETVLQFVAAIAKILLDNLLPQLVLNLSPLPSGVLQLEHELRPLLEKVASITVENLSDSEEDFNDIDSDVVSVASSTGGLVRDAAKDISSYVSCLMRLLPSMEHTLNVHEEQENPSSPIEFHVSDEARTYVYHVHNKFKNADTKLVSRLGEANFQRHVAIRQKIVQKDAVAGGEPVVEEVAQAPKSTFIPTSIFHDSGFGSMPAASNLAPTIASHSSFKTDGSRGGKTSFRVPEAPIGAYDGVPFPCSICGHVLKNIKDRYDWKIHVFADLQPYICTFSECSDSLLTFPTRRLWQEHEFSQHRLSISWTCPVCKKDLLSPDDWTEHIEANHRSALSDVEARYAFAAAKTTKAQSIELQKCPLCLTYPGASQRAFTTHVCKHMESIALAALPNEATSDSESDQSSTHSDQKMPPTNADIDVPIDSSPNVDRAVGIPWEDASDLGEKEDLRPNKCPISTCDYHIKGFVRKYDRNRHTLAHYKGKMVCGFCPGSGTAIEKSFNRADVFKRHLISVHAVEQTPPNAPRKQLSESKNKLSGYAPGATGRCSICSQVFGNAQDFYEHLDECVLRTIDHSMATPAEIEPADLRGRELLNQRSQARRDSEAQFGGESPGKDPYVLSRGDAAPTVRATAPEQAKGLPNVTSEIRQVVYNTVRSNNPPNLTGWKSNMSIEERVDLIFKFVGNLRLINPDTQNPPGINELLGVGINFEKESFEKSPDKVFYNTAMDAKPTQLLDRRNQNLARSQQTFNEQRLENGPLYSSAYKDTYEPTRNNVPKLDRTMTDIYADELYNPNFQVDQSTRPLSSQNDVFAERLRAANSQHLNASETSRSRESSSPFRQGSPLAPATSTQPLNARFHTASYMREQQKDEYESEMLQRQFEKSRDEKSPPRTVSPKDVLLEYFEGEEELSVPLFPPTQQIAPQRFQELSGPAADFPAHLTSMEASSDAGEDYAALETKAEYAMQTDSRSSKLDGPPKNIEHQPKISGIETSTSAATSTRTYNCPRHECSLQFESPVKLRQHLLETHMSKTPWARHELETSSPELAAPTPATFHRWQKPTEPPLSFTLNVASPSLTSPLRFPDLPTTTTMKELKARIRDTLPSKPVDKDQKLIYQGRLLSRETETMLDIFGKDTLETPDFQTLHLALRPGVDAFKQSAAEARNLFPGKEEDDDADLEAELEKELNAAIVGGESYAESEVSEEST